ncbi:MAG: hypothetical protein JHC52_12850, partial [Chthoniobacterales bacterium]|nr:hypothetical protein [Chthoniobacterales bacterium]
MEKPTAIPRPQVLETLLQGLPVQAGTAVRGLFDGLSGELKLSQGTLERSQARVRELELEIRLREEQLRLALIGKYGPDEVKGVMKRV